MGQIDNNQKTHLSLVEKLSSALNKDVDPCKIINSIGNGLSILDTDYRIIFQNHMDIQITGDHMGEFCYVAYDDENKVCNDCPLKNTFGDGGVHSIERKKKIESEWKYFQLTSSPLKDTNGEIVAGIIVTREISIQKRAEEKLKKYQEDLEERIRGRTNELIEQKKLTERVTEGIQEGILLLSRDLRVQWANFRQKETSGFSGDEIIGKYCYEVTHRSNTMCSPPHHVCPIETMKKTGEKCTEIHTHYSVDGDDFFDEVTCYPIKEKGKITGYVHISRDITDRIKAQQKIQELKEFNENIVQNMEEGILIENDEGFVSFANPRMLQILGTTGKELIGRHWTEIFSRDFHKKIETENSKLKEGLKTRFEASLEFDKKEIHVLVSASPLTETGLHVGNIKVFVDITERKKIEEKLRHQALRYKIERGGSYLVGEKVLDEGMDVFQDLVQAGYKGLIITRTPLERIAGSNNSEVLWLSEKQTGKGNITSELNLVMKSIEDFIGRNRVVLMDRLDYLIVQNGFSQVLKFLNRVIEMIYLGKGVLLVVVDHDVLSRQEQSLLEKEFLKVESRYRIKLEPELREILRFIETENKKGKKPGHSIVAEAMGISRPTLVKRLNELKDKELLAHERKGRTKKLVLTPKGKEAI